MTMRKRIESKSIKTIKTANGFIKGQKFYMSGDVWTVIKEEKADNTAMRKISSKDGEEEIVELKSLIRDLQEGLIKIM